MFIFSIVIAIFSSVFYHLSMRTVPTNANPFFLLFLAYIFASIVTLIVCIATQVNISGSMKELFATSSSGQAFSPSLLAAAQIGLAVVGIELGFLLAYRSGWTVVWAPLISNASVTLILLPIGLYFFREQLTPGKIIGASLCLSGIYLISRH